MKWVILDKDDKPVSIFSGSEVSVKSNTPKDHSYKKYDGPEKGTLIEQLMFLKSGSTHPLSDSVTKAKQKLLQDSETYMTLGFQSDALGETHTYGNSQTDQLNRLISVQSGSTCFVVCADISGNWQPKEHNQEQLLKVISDGAAWVDACRTQRKSLEEKLNSAKTQEDIDAVVWTKPQQGNNK